MKGPAAELEKPNPANGPTVIPALVKSLPVKVKLLGPAVVFRQPAPKEVREDADKLGTVVVETVQLIFTSSIPKPWSVVTWFESSHLIIKNSLLANVNPGIVKSEIETLFAARLPSKAPAVPEVIGLFNVKPGTCVQPLIALISTGGI